MKPTLRISAKGIVARVGQATHAFRRYRFCRNVFHGESNAAKRRALLLYLAEPFHLDPESKRFYYHQNYRQSLQIARCLREAGFQLDVMDYRDNGRLGLSAGGYQLLISHRHNLLGHELRIPTETTKVYLATGMNHMIFNRQLKGRLQYFAERRGCSLKSLCWTDEAVTFARMADVIVAFGNEYTGGTWRETSEAPIQLLNNYGFDWVQPVARDFSKARKNFLFFGSRQQLLKGLDWLLEIFPRHPDLNLFVCGRFYDEQDFCRCYRTELFETRNIHPLGVVRLDSRTFLHLAQMCAYVVHPSCSEGQSGSVVQCMHTGMVPIVTRESGLDPSDFGMIIEPSTVEGLEALILSASEIEPADLATKSKSTLEVADKAYSETAFVSRWREIVAQLARPM